MSKYNKATFIDNFNKVIEDHFNVKAEDAKYIIRPVHDPTKCEDAEDSVFRLIILSDDNVGNKKIRYDIAVDVLTIFDFLFPTKIVVSKAPEEDEAVFYLDCSTRVRKQSGIANINKEYAPFIVK